MRWLCIILFSAFGVLGIKTSVFAKDGGFEDEKGAVLIQGVSCFIEGDASVCFNGDLNIPDGAKLTNQGTIWFSNSNQANVVFAVDSLGSGKLVFSGMADLELQTTGTQIGSLAMKQKAGGVYLNGQLELSESLALQNGVLHVDEGGIVKVSNASPDAISFSNTIGACSFVNGTLARKILPEETYWFPVGSDDCFHPFFISQADRELFVDVAFDADLLAGGGRFPENQGIRSVEPGGWRVKNEDPLDVRYFAGASLLDEQQRPLSFDNYALLYAPPEDFLFSNYTMDVDAWRTSDFYLQSRKPMKEGFFGIARESDLKLVNFILVNGTSKTIFEVPNIAEYDRIKLQVFNRWGAMVFESHNYQNDMDVREYPQGSYYYEMTLWTGSSSSVIRNVIEIKVGQ